MNENYIIEGNAVYEIDAQCRQEKYGDVIENEVKLSMVHGTVEDNAKDCNTKAADEKVSVFFE